MILCVCIGSFNSSLRPPETFFKVIFWLGYFNSCLNPIIYPCYSREFKQVMLVSSMLLFGKHSTVLFWVFFTQAFIQILRCQWKRKRPRWQAYPNYRRHQGSNNSSFLNSSQQTLSSVSPSTQGVTSRPRPPAWSHPSGRKLHSGPTGRGGTSLVTRLAKDPGTDTVVNIGQTVSNEGRHREPCRKLAC